MGPNLVPKNALKTTHIFNMGLICGTRFWYPKIGPNLEPKIAQTWANMALNLSSRTGSCLAPNNWCKSDNQKAPDFAPWEGCKSGHCQKGSASGMCRKGPDLASKNVQIWNPKNKDRHLDLCPVLYEAAGFLLRPSTIFDAWCTLLITSILS